MPIRKILMLCFMGIAFSVQAQRAALSPSSKISLITCGAGEELYSTFGHSAFRVFDADLGIDVVYNYGTFNFNTPMFYVKFARGKLLYSLSRQRFDDFLYEYQLEKRWVKEQVLQLDAIEKAALFDFLEDNFLPENRDYQYDFLFDNCATKMGDVLEKTFGDALHYQYDHLKERFTFRELIHQNLETNSWSAFGIDLALGSLIDRKATPHEHLFLPEFVMRQMSHTQLKNRPIVQQERTLLDEKPRTSSSNCFAKPLFWIILLSLFVVLITYWDVRKKRRSRWLDFGLFFVTGVAGMVICFLWFLTEHSTTPYNFNILWAFPLHLLAAFYLLRKKSMPKIIQGYITVILVLLGIAVLLWILKIQTFSPLLTPLLIALSVRYLFLRYHFKKCMSTKS